MPVTRPRSDQELIELVISEQYQERITGKTFEAFTEWALTERPLSDKQKAWLYGVAERLGLMVAPGENLFSKLSPFEQRRQREKAKAILPWEK